MYLIIDLGLTQLTKRMIEKINPINDTMIKTTTTTKKKKYQ